MYIHMQKHQTFIQSFPISSPPKYLNFNILVILFIIESNGLNTEALVEVHIVTS